MKYHSHPSYSYKVMSQKCVNLSLGDMNLSQGYDVNCVKFYSRSNMPVRGYGPDVDFGYLSTVMTSEL